VKKSGWISFCGWAGIALVLLGVAASQFYGRGDGHGAFALLTFFSLVFAVPCFGLWALGSLVHKFRVSGARIQAQAFVEAKQRAAAGTMSPRPAAPMPPAVPPRSSAAGR
jgi:hypothetical protein